MFPFTSSNRRSPVLSLLWKEVRQVRALAIALILLGTLCYGLLWLWGSISFDEITVLLPNLFALGAPVLMIGHEQETGTLVWSRCLPIGWKKTFFTKWLVALLGLTIAWALSLFFYQWTPNAYRSQGELSLMESPLYMVAFSWTLLSGGFLLSWWLHKPIPTLFALSALMSVISLVCLNFSEARQATPLLATIGAVLAVASTYFARRTWTKPWERKSTRSGNRSEPILRPYRPTSQVPLASPGPRAALLWQHAMQALPVALPAFAVGCVAALFPLLDQRFDEWMPLQGLVATIAVLVLGASTFVTDNAQGRQRFLSDRGFASWTVWWTRQLLPGLLSVVLVALIIGGVWLSAAPTESQRWAAIGGLVATLIAAFVSGQLTAMVVQRPTLAILAAPLTLVAIFFTVMPVVTLYDFRAEVLASFAFGLPILWLSTLWLCRRWLEDRRTIGFYSGAAGWVAVAAVISFGGLVAQRWFTTPSAMPAWKGQVLQSAAALPPLPAGTRPLQFLTPESWSDPAESLYETSRSINESEQAVFSEMAALSLSHYFEGILNLPSTVAEGESEPEQRQRAEVYAELIEAAFLTLERYRNTQELRFSDLADGMEWQLVDELSSARARRWLSKQQLADFADRFATAEQRRTARRDALLRSYRKFSTPVEELQLQGVNNQDLQSRNLGGYWVMGKSYHLFPWERYRTRRIVDLAVRRTLEDLDRPAGWVPARHEVWERIWEAPWVPYSTMPTVYWDLGIDGKVQRLKAERG